jgi:hypothetical protein
MENGEPICFGPDDSDSIGWQNNRHHQRHNYQRELPAKMQCPHKATVCNTNGRLVQKVGYDGYLVK